MTNSILKKKDIFFIMLHCLLQVDYVFDFFNKILHTTIISKRNITFLEYEREVIKPNYCHSLNSCRTAD